MDIRTDYETAFYNSFAEYFDSLCGEPDNFYNTDFNLETDLFAAICSCLYALAQEQSQTFDRAFVSNTLSEIKDMLITKNGDYGGAVFARPVYAPTLPVETAILVRMSDKVTRYKNLAHKCASHESKVDTLKDYIGYGILLTLALYGDGGIGNTEPEETSAPESKLVMFYAPGMTLGEITSQLQNGNIPLYPAD